MLKRAIDKFGFYEVHKERVCASGIVWLRDQVVRFLSNIAYASELSKELVSLLSSAVETLLATPIKKLDISQKMINDDDMQKVKSVTSHFSKFGLKS